MKNKKKNPFKNRIKRFFIKPGDHGINRVKEDQEDAGPQGANNEGPEGDQDLQNPEEQEDLS